jgi:hypothetical protein
MENELTMFGNVDKNGVVTLYGRDTFMKHVKNGFREQKIQFTLSKRIYEFSDSQRAYYFAVITKGIQDGYNYSGVTKSRNDIDLEMREKFLYYEEVNEETGFLEKHLHTLKKGNGIVSSSMMRIFCQMCIIWTKENLIWSIPFPNEEFDEWELQDNEEQKEVGVKDKSTT